MSGNEIECPSCNNTLTIPDADPSLLRAHSPTAASAAAREAYHFSVPVHDHPAESLIEKPKPPLEAASKDGDKRLRIKCIRRSDCVEVGKDRFDETVNEFLKRLSEGTLVAIQTLSYTHQDLATREMMVDYGVMIVYKG